MFSKIAPIFSLIEKKWLKIWCDNWNGTQTLYDIFKSIAIVSSEIWSVKERYTVGPGWAGSLQK